MKKLKTHYLAAHPKKREGWEKKLSQNPEEAEAEFRRCALDPWYFLTGWGKTLDQHGLPVKPFPPKAYLRLVVERLLEKNLLIIYKSRQMMISWLLSGLCLWEALFQPGKLAVLQTKKADDADHLIKRAHFIWRNLPDFIRNRLPINPQKKGGHVYGRLIVPDLDSEMMGIP